MLQTLTLTPDNSTDVNFRAWGSAISAALTAAGFPLTADTGQINWTTVTHPTTASASTGYEIRTFSDAAQATAPIYFKVTYGSSTLATTPQIYVTAGTGSDGAGNITGTYFPLVTAANQVTSIRQLHFSATSPFTGSTTVYLTSDASGFVLLAWPYANANNSTGAFLCLERTRAFDGTATTDGFHLLNAYSDGTATAAQTQNMVSFLPNTTKLDAVATNLVQPGSSLVAPASNLIGGVLYTVPVLTGVQVKIGGPSQFVLAVPAMDMVGGTTATITHYGVSYTWRALGYGCSVAAGQWGSGPQNLKSYLVRVS